MSQGKRWLFTINNYTSEEYESLIRFLNEESVYYVVGKEKGSNGTPHLQGYTELTKRHRFLSLKNKVCSRSHLELARGTGDDNRRYCIKEGDFVEHGRLGRYRQGSSSARSGSTRDELGLKFAQLCTDNGIISGCKQFAEEEPGCYYFSGHTLLRNFLTNVQPPERSNICVWWYYGSTGTGKSRRAYAEYPGAYRKDGRTKWWHGYSLQSSCVIDDFSPGGIDLVRLLVWFDRYPCIVESKGGMLPLCVVNFVVTSNFHPKDLFTQRVITSEAVEDHPQLPALMRRINLLCFDYIFSNSILDRVNCAGKGI